MTTISHPSPRPRASRLPRPRSRLVAVVAVVVVLVAVAVPLGLRATGGGASSVGASVAARPGAAANGSADSTGSRGASGSAGAGADAGAGSSPGAAASGTASDVVIGPKVSRSAWLGLKVSDLGTASARARVVATDAGGQVTSENVVTSVDPTGGLAGDPQNGGVGSSSTDTAPSHGTDNPTGTTTRSTSGSAGSSAPSAPSAPSVPQVGVDQARMVLNVPSKALDEVLTQLSALGAVSYRSSQSEDVTDTYIDTKARIQPLQDGIERVRALLAKTTDLQQVITLESELSRRQADLDSLTQRLAQLDAETTTSDVTVSMWTDATPPAQTAPGFTGGLHSAWDSLLGSLTVVLTGLAALLPWLVLLTPLVLLGLRVRRRRGTGASAARSSSQAAD